MGGFYTFVRSRFFNVFNLVDWINRCIYQILEFYGIFIFIFLVLCLVLFIVPTYEVDGSLLIKGGLFIKSLNAEEFFNKDDECFSNKMEKLKDLYYLQEYGPCDKIRSSISKDCRFELNIFGLSFHFIEDFYKIVIRDFDYLELICIVEGFLTNFLSVNKRGYISERFLDDVFTTHIMTHLESLGYESKVLGNNEMSYTYWHNLIFLNLYYLLTEKILSFDKVKVSVNVNGFLYELNVFEMDELFCKLEVLQSDVYSRLDQYLKGQILKRGITIIQNTYAGFDCEYETSNEFKLSNKLVSVQTALQRRTIIKIPLYHTFDLAYVNPLSSEISDVYNNKKGGESVYTFKSIEGNVHDDDDGNKKIALNEMFIINESLKYCVDKIRMLVFGDLFLFNTSLITQMRVMSENYDGFLCYDDRKRDQFVFSMPLTPLDCKIVYPDDGCFTIIDLLGLLRSSTPSIDSMFFKLNSLICVKPFDGGFECSEGDYYNNNSLESGAFTNNSSLDKNRGGEILKSSLTARNVVNDNVNVNVCSSGSTLDCNDDLGEKCYIGSSLTDNFVIFVKLLLNFGITLDSEKLFKWYQKTQFKPRLRTSVFYKDVKLSLSVVNNTYIVGHYNAADLPMLSDFDEKLKNKLSIVNKSFVSLGRALKIDNTNVYFRDTILLAPTGNASLKALGKLYEGVGDFSKREITKEDINNMSGFLKRDPVAFKEYAIQDAIITLKHALSMEQFNMSVKQLGVPLTLSSIGRNYVFKE
jgi:hypothetical protein